MDINVIAENLTELLQNTINMTSVYYDIFLNPEPMDVELKQFNSDNELVTISLPNRAKDRKIALDGEGSPEGAVEANIGACYVDTLNQVVYFKATGSGNTGWVIVLDSNGLDAYLQNNGYMNEEGVATYLVNNNYVTEQGVSDIVSEDTIVDMIDLSEEASSEIFLEDNKSYCLRIGGDIDFILPTVQDLGKLHRIILQFEYTGSNANLGVNYIVGGSHTYNISSGHYTLYYEYDCTLSAWVCDVKEKTYYP